MGFLKFFVFFFLLFCFVTCGVDPRLKRISPPVKVIKNVESTYNPSVDILFIIDDSISMSEEQEVLAKNAEIFINHFLGISFINYHIGVTTSSIDFSGSLAGDGKLNRCREEEKKSYDKVYKYSGYVDKKTYKGADCLKEMLQVGTGGSITERFLNIPPLVFSKENLKHHNAGFYRPEAHLAVFVITDTYDQSDVIPEEAYKFLLNLKGGNQDKIHYALGAVTLEIPPSCEKDGQDGNMNLQEMVELFGLRGYEFDLCQSDYGQYLAKFATHLVQSVLTISLDNIPDISSIEVYYEYAGGVQSISNGPEGWSYDANNNTINLSPDIQLEDEEGKFRIKYQPLYTSERQ